MKSLQERVNDALNSTEAEIERAKIEFTEELLAQMEAQRISRSELAKSLGVKPSRVTTLLRGANNFTLETMVRICRAIGGRYKHYIQAPSLLTVSYNASPWVASAAPWRNAVVPCSISASGNLSIFSVGWDNAASPVLASGVLILPSVGQADLIENHKKIEIPKIDADLALAA
jgi:predicted XRE-type DNA-binding protein